MTIRLTDDLGGDLLEADGWELVHTYNFRWTSPLPAWRGASVETLLRRAGYGNRKGRSAARRLEKLFPKWELDQR